MEAVRHENEKGTEAKAEIEIEIKTEEGEGRENAEREAMTETETSNCCNQETETAAMMKCGGGGNAIETTTPTTTKTTMRLEDVAFVMPATPTTTVIRTTKASKSANSSRSSSLRKQRRNNSDAAAAAGVASGVGGGGQANNDMKTSQSMTSLPADELQQERRDVIQAKLHLERPYNSLKKNSQSNKCSSGGSSNNNKMHRYSWGSGHSHSSSTSLHSSATLGLGSSGKDDLWAAIQTNYNYIMDTNLLDTCKEARFEIEEAQPTSRECKFTGSQLHILDETQRQEGLCEDPKELRRWLRDMENKLESSPTISELTLYSNSELQRHLAVHSVLYHEIVSHARVVSACIRAASERERAAEQQSQQTATATATQQPASLTSNCSSESTTSESVTKSNSLSSGFASDGAPLTTPSTAATTAAPTATAAPSTAHPRKGEGNLERLRDRYHLLYLKAFELQLCLDNLLRKRSSTATGLDDDDDTEDDSFGYEGEEGDAATEDDLNEVVSDLDLECESAASHNSAELLLQRCQVAATEIVSANVPAATEDQSRDCIATQKPGDEADEEPDEEDDNSADVVDFVIAKRAWRQTKLNQNSPTAPATLTDFEADSESSDLEQVQQLHRRNVCSCGATAVVATTVAHSRRLGISSTQQQQAEMSQSQTNGNSSTNVSLLQTRHGNKMLPQCQHHHSAKPKSIAVAVITPNTHHHHHHNNNHNGHGLDLNKSPTVLRKSSSSATTTTAAHRGHNDTSKFNRSNRKSKNCAIFYFKHLDTDNETSGAGTDAAGDGDADLALAVAQQQILKSADASSDDDDEGWLYTAATTAGATAAVTATSTVDGLQSAAISSTTSGATAAATVGTTAAGATATTTSDDSDKENKETLVSTSTTATTASIATSAVSVGVVLVGSGSGSNSNYDSSSACSSSNSNGVHTETSATSRVTQMQRSGVVVSVMDMEMQLQSGSQSSDGSHSNNNNHNTRHIISNNCYKQLQSDNNNSSSNSQQSQQLLNANNNNNNNYNNHKHQQQSRIDSKQQQQQQQQQIADEATAADNANGNAAQLHLNSNNNNNGCSFYSRADICNISVWPSEMTNGNGNVQQQNVANGNRLPPRSPAKSVKSQASSSNATMSPSKGKVSHDSIKQLVLEAEHLVRDAQEAALKTPTKQKHSIIKISSTVKKRDIIMPGPIKQRVEEWLEHQPSTPQLLNRNHHSHEAPSSKPDDCEASGEASETDSMPHKDATCGVGSDSSEGFTDSIATCMQTSTNSYGNSTERIGGSAEPIHQPTTPLGFGSSNQSLNVKVVKRPQSRRKSERPWSVSCLSQLTTDAAQLTTIIADVGQSSPPGLASHSISESALDSLSPGPRARAASSSGTGSNAARKADSKGSLRRRRARKKRMSAASGGRKSDSGSETHGDLTQTLMKSCESMSSQQLQEFTNALLSIQKGGSPTNAKAEEFLPEGESESHLMVPKFRVGSFTTAALMASEIRLGALAALSNYMNEDEQQAELSTEDHHSSISETAWDDYQEKYNSENYSEGFDSDAARRLLEFGDDYRNFIDSQSDCCSSLSAANNLDSFSPPRMDSLQQHELKALHINQETISSSVDHARRQRALELQSERRRKTLEVRRKSCQDMAEAINSQTEQQQQQQVTTANLSSSATALMTPKNPPATRPPVRTESVGRKLEFGAGMSHSAQSLLRRTSESDTSTRRRRTVTADERRRSSRNLEKCIKLIPATSSSSGDDSEDGEQEMRSLLQQSRDRLEDTRALKIRCHLLRPEDYHEIINTCRDNIRCLEAVLRGPPGTVLSTHCAGQTKDLLAAWEDLLNWSENAAGARKLQQEMSALKHTLRRLGDNATPELLDTEPAIQIAVEALKQEQTQLGSYRTNMLRLNASVHSWLTRQERRLQQEQQQQQQQESEQLQQLEKQQQLELKQQQLEQQQLENGNANSTVAITVTDSNGNQVVEASTGTSSNWDVNSLLSAEQEFHKHLKDEVSDMYSAWDEADARINSQLEMLTNSLIAWRQLECGLSEFQLALGQDRGTLKGLEGALDKGQATPVELAQNVKLVAKLLSEKVNVSQEQLLAVQQHLDPNHIYHIAKFTASNGSLSDSGISDGGATSDGGLSERERRLGVLRRLAKQLELALAPGSAAMRSIAARMESAEAELKQLQNTCRDLIVRTAASHQQKQQQQEQQQKQQQQQQQVEHQLANGHVKQQALKPQQAPQQSSPKRRNARKARQAAEKLELQQKQLQQEQEQQVVEQLQRIVAAGGGDDPEDPANEAALLDNSEDEDDTNSKAKRRGWAWRIARAAVPMQLALFTFFCAACMMQPNCCDNLNNLSMSFTPQLRYIRGPPPI
ncbi:klarsicht protein isoform X2 [Drosophila nasuta]|uniref:klarsicht protein isoform X2 n=1 Tax=Drosophila nasuta TaxID=42062 RepID=UPI00295ED2BE|nr:klarsicht protein isoform X2 [Drosophila nasuta]